VLPSHITTTFDYLDMLTVEDVTVERDRYWAGWNQILSVLDMTNNPTVIRYLRRERDQYYEGWRQASVRLHGLTASI
jgi:hypothetical protein